MYLLDVLSTIVCGVYKLTDMDSTRDAVGQLVQLVASYKVVYKVRCRR